MVATPIGNLEDISARALRVLREVNLIAAEDTRHSRKLLAHYGISTPLTSYHEHNEADKAGSLVERIRAGQSIALISDAGTPCISDPGFRVVQMARAHGIPVRAIPGPSAVVAALSVSGLPADRFTYHGFFPRKQSIAAALETEIRRNGGTHVFYESPHRLIPTLQRLARSFPSCVVSVFRELTKIHEDHFTGSIEAAAAHFASAPVRGECVFILSVPAETPEREWTVEQLRERVHEAMQREGLSRRDAVVRVAELSGVPRNQVYAATVNIE